MNWLSRPGAKLITLSILLVLGVVVVQSCNTAQVPGFQIFQGTFYLFWRDILGALVWLLSVVGYVQYSDTKGYKPTIAFWLSWYPIGGLIVLLLLPDLRADKNNADSKKGSDL